MHFITTLSQFFNLSHEHIQPPPANSDQPLPPLPVFVPEGTVALTAAHYLIKLLTDLGESVTELVSLNLPKQSSEDLNELMINVRWRFADTLCLLWVRG